MIVEAEAPRAAAGGQPVPPSLDELVARCLFKDPATRPQSVADLIAVFTEVLRADPWTPTQAAAWWRTHRAGTTAARPAAPGTGVRPLTSANDTRG
jgi:hypothetical protein